jgi:predicted Zn-dependent peptidase
MRESILVQLLFNLLFGWTSPYYKNWYAEGKIDESMSIEYEVSSRYSFVIMTMDTAEPIRMSSLIRQVMTSADKQRLLTEEALDLQKKALYGEFLRSLDNIQNLGSQYLAYSDDGKTYFDFGQELMSITSKDLKDFFNHYLSNLVITDFVVFPK